MGVGIGAALSVREHGQDQALEKCVAEEDAVASHRGRHEARRKSAFQQGDGRVLPAGGDVKDFALTSEYRLGPGRRLLEGLINKKPHDDLSISRSGRRDAIAAEARSAGFEDIPAVGLQAKFGTQRKKL